MPFPWLVIQCEAPKYQRNVTPVDEWLFQVGPRIYAKCHSREISVVIQGEPLLYPGFRIEGGEGYLPTLCFRISADPAGFVTIIGSAQIDILDI